MALEDPLSEPRIIIKGLRPGDYGDVAETFADEGVNCRVDGSLAADNRRVTLVSADGSISIRAQISDVTETIRAWLEEGIALRVAEGKPPQKSRLHTRTKNA